LAGDHRRRLADHRINATLDSFVTTRSGLNPNGTEAAFRRLQTFYSHDRPTIASALGGGLPVIRYTNLYIYSDIVIILNLYRPIIHNIGVPRVLQWRGFTVGTGPGDLGTISP